MTSKSNGTLPAHIAHIGELERRCQSLEAANAELLAALRAAGAAMWMAIAYANPPQALRDCEVAVNAIRRLVAKAEGGQS
jgi:hypothetical protein